MVLLKNEEEWNVAVADMAKNTFNPIRNILETMNIQPHPDKPMISLSIGDPTIFGNLNPSSNAITAITEALKSGKYNGYAPSSGYVEARQAIADHVSCGGKKMLRTRYLVKLKSTSIHWIIKKTNILIFLIQEMI